MSISGDRTRRWIPPLAVLIAAALVTGGIVLATGGKSPHRTAQAAAVHVSVPATVSPPLEVWDVAAASTRPHSGAPAPAFVVTISARLELPSHARDLVVDIDGAGVFTATSPDRIASPSTRPAIRWRWAVPLRDQPPPYSIPVRVTARYSAAGTVHRISGRAETAVRPPAPPHSSSWVSDLTFDYAVNGYGPVRRDHSVSGILTDSQPPLKLDGKPYSKGIGTNSRSDVGVFLGGACTNFQADVGVDDSSGAGGTVTFSVIGDGRTLTQTPVVTGKSELLPLQVDITGVRQLDLVVGTGGDGQGNDHADWAGARVDCE
ncbi:MAG TPA: NPCBM/NEW2 domain-containing protein [Mycobacteriales bacterium]|nr:NPCBM/NEW2 domain-containing protein [Mycobacteriales bacterium]